MQSFHQVRGCRTAWLVLELWAGWAMLTAVANSDRAPGWEALRPRDLIYGDDFLKPKTQTELIDDIEK